MKFSPVFSNVVSVIGLLDKHEKRNLVVVFGAMLFTALLEVAGVGSIMPFITVASDPGIAVSNKYLSFVYRILGFSEIRGFVLFLGFLVLALLILGNAAKAILTYVIKRYTLSRVCTLAVRLFESYLGQPYVFFLKSNSTDLMKNITKEVPNIINGVLTPALETLSKLIVVVLLVALIFAVDPFIAILTVIVLSTAYVLLYFLIRRTIERLGKERFIVEGLQLKSILEAFGGIKDVKLLGREMSFVDAFAVPSRKLARNNALNEVLADTPKYALEALAFGSMLTVVLYYIWVARNFGTIVPVISLYAFAGYRLMPSIQIVFRGIAQLAYFDSSVAIVKGQLRDYRVNALKTPVMADRLPFKDTIRLDGIDYSYPGTRKKVLHGVSLDIKKNTTVGFVGMSGSGKTTTIDILLGLLEADKGAIRVDGEKLGGETLRRWQLNLGYVPQQIFLSDDSVEHNIAFGIPAAEIDRKSVELSARIANLHDFVLNELPEGYATNVGERGVRLSGGQRQRIGIARALYHQPEVLILDEATSALDSMTEEAVMEAMRALSGKKTLVMIAHRITTVRECDVIYCMDHGSLVDQGKYDDLLARSTIFQRLARGHAR